MLRIQNPATEEIIAELETDTGESIAQKYEAARVAQWEWAQRPLEERIDCLKRFNSLLQGRAPELAAVMTSETGKPIRQSAGEIAAVGARIEFFSANVAAGLASETVSSGESGGMIERISYEPLGVVGNISAWNYPYFVGVNVFAPALLTGNAVLYKPSEFATLTGISIGELLWEAGVPRDVFALLIGGGEVGQGLLEQPLGGMYFTGSHRTGTRIAQAASSRLMRVQLELGGKDPAYVADDVDLEAVAAGLADGAFYNAGQSCCSVERIYVHERVYDSFVELFVRIVEEFQMGDPVNPDTYIGPLTRAPQIQVLEGQIADAIQKGARLVAGGRAVDRPGFYFEPTVLVDVDHSMELMVEESFGPIIGIQKVADDREALTRMNDSRYGLTASVFTTDQGRAESMLAHVQAGSAYWNCCDRVSPRLPWTGWKDSGVGSTLGMEGIRAFVQPKGWHLRS